MTFYAVSCTAVRMLRVPGPCPVSSREFSGPRARCGMDDVVDLKHDVSPEGGVRSYP